MRAMTMTAGLLTLLGVMGCGKKDDAPAPQASAATASAAPKDSAPSLATASAPAPSDPIAPAKPSDPAPTAAGAYAAGDVLKHMPPSASCTKGRVFVDLSKLLKPEMAAQIDAKLASMVLDAEAQQMLNTLTSTGLHLAGDTKEIAACVDDREHVTLAVGGNFAGKDLMGALTKATAAIGELSVKKEEVDGLTILSGTGNGAFAQVEPNVLLFAVQKGDLLAAAKRVSRAAEWPTAGMMVWAQMVDRKLTADLQAVEKGDGIALKWIADMKGAGAEKMKTDPEGMKSEIKREISKMAAGLAGSPFTQLADDLRAAKLEVDGTKLTISGTVSNAHVAEALKAVEDAVASELGSTPARRGRGGSNAVKLMEDAATAACACKDAKCAADAMKGVEGEMKRAMAKGTPSSVEMKAISAAAKQMAECTMKLAGAGVPK